MGRGTSGAHAPGYAKTLGFLIPALGIDQTLIDWYENEHSVYASFMWQHMRRCQRNYIIDVQRGPVPLYRVVSEFAWKGEEDKRSIAALYATPAVEQALNEVFPKFIIMPFPPDGFFLLPVTESEAAAGGRRSFRHDEPRRLKIVLLRRPAGEGAAPFEAAVAGYARRLADRDPQAAVNIDFRREAQTVPAPADAIVFVDA